MCSAKQEHFDAKVEAVQQVSVYKLAKPYQLIGRWQCCPACFEAVGKEIKKLQGGVMVIWPLTKEGNNGVNVAGADGDQ